MKLQFNKDFFRESNYLIINQDYKTEFYESMLIHLEKREELLNFSATTTIGYYALEQQP